QCLNDAGVPAARVRRIDEALAEEQTATRGVMAQSELQSGGRTLSFPVAAFGFEHGGPALSGPPPRHGQHSREVLAEAGFSAEEIEGLVASGTVG
ncbi:MAG: CoA transferase, partial [Rhodospirillaceae bacterium]|nr:CoA transferase [Rhodospirillaceae bacterium]